MAEDYSEARDRPRAHLAGHFGLGRSASYPEDRHWPLALGLPPMGGYLRVTGGTSLDIASSSRLSPCLII